MKTSTEIASIARIVGEAKAIELVAKAGFDAWDFSMFAMGRYDWGKDMVIPSDHPLAGPGYLNFARELGKIAKECGIVCNQSHAPFPVCCKEIRDMMKKAIECTAEVGGEYCIIHPDNHKPAEVNAEMFNELLPFAKSCGVKIATENMFNWDRETDCAVHAACSTAESFNAHLDAVKDDYLVACLDLGHAEIFGNDVSAVGMIKALGPRLKALHMHDNDKKYDKHQIPFSNKIDFVPIVKALKCIGYDGYFTLEADTFMRDYTPDTAAEGVAKLYAAARRLADMFEQA